MTKEYDDTNLSYQELGEVVDTAIRKIKIRGEIDEVIFDMALRKITISFLECKIGVPQYYEIYLHNVFGESFACHFRGRDSIKFPYRRL